MRCNPQRLVAAATIFAALSGCGAKEPDLAGMTMEQLAPIAERCKARGESEADDYCRRAVNLYGDARFKRAEAERLERARAQGASMPKAVSEPKF